MFLGIVTTGTGICKCDCRIQTPRDHFGLPAKTIAETSLETLTNPTSTMAYKQVSAAAVAYRFAQKRGSLRIRS